MTKKMTNEEKLQKAIKKALNLGIELDGSETLEDVLAKIDLVEATPSTENTVFTLKNGATRVFSLADHGDEWEELADEFQKTNIDKILTRDNELV